MTLYAPALQTAKWTFWRSWVISSRTVQGEEKRAWCLPHGSEKSTLHLPESQHEIIENVQTTPFPTRNHSICGLAVPSIRPKLHCLWRAVDQEGEVVDMFLHRRRGAKAAKRFFRKLLGKNKGEPRSMLTDKSRGDGVAHRELVPGAIHDTSQSADNRVERSHQPTGVEKGSREGSSRWCKHSGSWMFIPLSQIYSTWGATIFSPRTIEISDSVHLRPGKRWWRHRATSRSRFRG